MCLGSARGTMQGPMALVMAQEVVRITYLARPMALYKGPWHMSWNKR